MKNPDRMGTWNNNRILALGRASGLKVTRKTHVVSCAHNALVRPIAQPLEPFWITGNEPPEVQYEQEEIRIKPITGAGIVYGLGYGPRSDTLVVRFR